MPRRLDVFLQAPELKAVFVDRALDGLAVKGMRHLLFVSDVLDQLPGTMPCGQRSALTIGCEAEQGLTTLRPKIENDHLWSFALCSSGAGAAEAAGMIEELDWSCGQFGVVS
jgi:hypothetical protein